MRSESDGDARRRSQRRVALALVAVVVMLASGGCSNGPAGEAAASSTDTSADVTVRTGRVVEGPGLLRVGRGQAIQVTVDADVDDQVHIHGYDIYRPMQAGEPVVISFDADIPGSFDVELERTRLHLLEIQVG